MKKILCLVMVLIFAFSAFSCDKKISDVERIAGIINESNPTKLVTMVNYTVGDVTFVGKYTTQKDNVSGNSQFDYEYQRKAIPGVDAGTESIKTISGTVYQDANGNVYGDDFEQGSAYGYMPYSINLSENRLASYNLSEDGNTINATVSPDEAIRVFGTEVSAEGDISLKVVTSGEYLYNVEITYTAKDTGAVVVIKTSYDYTNVTVKLG